MLLLIFFFTISASFMDCENFHEFNYETCIINGYDQCFVTTNITIDRLKRCDIRIYIIKYNILYFLTIVNLYHIILEFLLKTNPINNDYKL